MNTGQSHSQAVAEIFRRLDALHGNQNDLIEPTGLGADKISKIKSGTRTMKPAEQDAARAYLSRREREQAAANRGVRSDHAPTQSVDIGETAIVQRLDLSYAMGPGTNLDESYVEGEPVVFDLSFLRSLTPSSPDMLRVVDGIGDSMTPTIHDRDWLILDLGQRDLNMQDRIWAMSLFGVGAVKRLQAVGKGRVLVISDNPDVPNTEVSMDDIVLVGRIVGSIRRH